MVRCDVRGKAKAKAKGTPADLRMSQHGSYEDPTLHGSLLLAPYTTSDEEVLSDILQQRTNMAGMIALRSLSEGREQRTPTNQMIAIWDNMSNRAMSTWSERPFPLSSTVAVILNWKVQTLKCVSGHLTVGRLSVFHWPLLVYPPVWNCWKVCLVRVEGCAHAAVVFVGSGFKSRDSPQRDSSAI